MKNISRLRAVLNKRKRAPFQEAAEDELKKLIQKQVSSGLADLFGGESRKRGVGGDSPVFGGSALPPYAPSIPMGGRSSGGNLESMIDQMVASSLMHGRQTSGILRTLFGIVPSLIGR